MEAFETVGWEVFARIRVELMAVGLEQELVKETEALNYSGYEESREG
jgi:hypothetical protein